MAKKKGPPQPRKKSPEELKEEAFRAKCEEAAKAKAVSNSAAAPPSASTAGVKIVRPASTPNLVAGQLSSALKKSGSAAELAAKAPPAISPAEEAELLEQVNSASEPAQLSKALGCPSDKVRRAAANALKAMAGGWAERERASAAARMLEQALAADTASAERASGAMGAAAVAAVDGPRALSALGVWEALETATREKKQPQRREGAAAVVGALAMCLGRGFEPNLVRAVPMLLSMLDDGSQAVRDGAVAACASRALPQIAEAIRGSKWTCKAGALQLLSAAAEAAPSATYAQFPAFMPAVRDALAETHPKVKAQAEATLADLCKIVEYPEVVTMIDAVQAALVSPVAQMADCLDVMMDITFVNAVDAPPLELVVPILGRALKDRKAELRKKAAKTCGNMCTLVLHPRVLVPHVPILLPGIKAGLVESQPEVREVCARALTGMVQGMGGPPVYELLPVVEKLQATMTDADSAEERDRAHQALEALAEDEIRKCTDAIRAETEESLSAQKDTVAELHKALAGAIPEGAPAEAVAHARAVAEAAYEEAEGRPDGKGSLHAAEAVAEAFGFLREYVGAEPAAAAAEAAAEVIRRATESAGGAEPPSGDERIVDLRNIILAYPGRVLLQRSHLHMDRGHCYGLVGQNGVGKTTIMTRIAQKDIHNFPTHLKCVYVQHEVHRGINDGETVHSFMKTQVPNETDDDISEALRSVGFSEKMIHGPVVDLSGGWRMKLAIARAMLQRADILLLDEPTNHLDAASVAWLAGYIRSLKNTTVMIVSHDADFMEQVVTDVIHIHDLRLTYYTDGFGNFRRRNPTLFPEDGAAAGGADQGPATEQGTDEGGKLTAADETAAPADGSAADSEANPPQAEETPSPEGGKPYGTYDFTSQPFKFPDPGKLDGIRTKRKPVLTMTGVSFRYPGAEKDTLRDINVKLTLMSRVALVGANGAGKTTLLRLLVEDLPTNPGVGEVWKHHNLRLSYVAQHSMHHLESNINNTPVGYIQDRFGFGKDKEVESKVTMKLTDEEKAIMAQRGEISEVLGRRKLGKMIEYEVLRTGRKPEDSQWFNMNDLKLQKPYVMKLVKAYDEKMAAMASGADQRPLTGAEIKKHLQDFGINEVLATGKIKNLSGGQKSRLVMAAAMWSKPHLLALDEPTNYIDRETLAALAESLKTFNGGVFLISHNAAFVEEVCDEQWVVADGTCRPPEKIAGKGSSK
uniref:Elongation factor 3 n=1 Tax=Tetraselmis sp. GSL018 TaxID=582737 RepID=A0A061RRX4_9CHLO